MANQGQRFDPSGRRVEESQLKAQHFDPSGSRLDREAAEAVAQAAARAAVSAEAAEEQALGTSTAHLELRNGGVSLDIEVTVRLDVSPFWVIGGMIRSGICGAPWSVSEGSSMGNSLRLEGKRLGANNCADTITVVGEFENPNSWRGTYGFDGSSDMFGHTTLFRGWGSCPP